MSEKIIVIGGGVGPMAGVELHKRIIENTLTDGTDQTHIEVHHYSRSHDIADRTEFLLGKVKADPAEGMLRTIQAATAAAQICGKKAVAGVPCNTFHAPAIFDKFLHLIEKEQLPIQIVHMLRETAALIKQLTPTAKKIGLLSTTGTRKVRVYRDILEPLGFELIELPEETQPELHDSIYNQTWGIKAVSPVSDLARSNFVSYVERLSKSGSDAIILGCTEIPLALPEKTMFGIPLIDPMLALARALIHEANPKKLKPLDAKIHRE